MFDRITAGIGFVCTGLARRSRQSIVLAAGGVLAVIGGLYLFGSNGLAYGWKALRQCWHKEETMTFFYAGPNPEDLLEETDLLLPPAMMSSDRHRELISPTSMMADAENAQRLQQSLQSQQQVVADILRTRYA